jgi:cytochrome c-type biogenesis protein CcmH/NrfG
MGDILAKQGRYADAIQHYRRALEIKPQEIAVECDLAWLLATCPVDGLRNGVEALKMARKVCTATGNSSIRAFDVLAAANAEVGHFDAAVAAARKALELLCIKVCGTQSEPDKDLSQDTIGSRLRLYKSGKPYRLTVANRVEPNP